MDSDLLDSLADAKYDLCSWCNGFYGSNFGQPICSTCHMFLFTLENNPTSGPPFIEKTDSGDSGNEEPVNESDFYARSVGNGSPSHQLATNGVQDYLVERLNKLSYCSDFKPNKLPDGLVESLPTEVLLNLFDFLNDISLWAVSNVCQRWHSILEDRFSAEQWSAFIFRRWPIFKSEKLHFPCSWKSLYTQLLEGTTCLYCLENMVFQQKHPPQENNSWHRRRLRTEFKSLQLDPLDDIKAKPLNEFYSYWQASIAGPRNSPYDGGTFFLYLQIPDSYPMKPPVVRFMTKIFHPNVSRHGDIGLDSLNHNWSLALTITKILISIQSLLTDPFPNICMEPLIGELYVKDQKKFDEIARYWTKKYATLDMEHN